MTAAFREHFKAGEELATRGAFAEAERNLLLALKELHHYSPPDARCLEVYSSLAKLYIHQGNYGRAAQIYIRSLRILEKVNQARYLSTSV